MDSLGSNHSIPSMSVSTGSQSSSVNSMQEVMDESSSELVMMHDDENTLSPSSSVVHKKVRVVGLFTAVCQSGQSQLRPQSLLYGSRSLTLNLVPVIMTLMPVHHPQ